MFMSESMSGVVSECCISVYFIYLLVLVLVLVLLLILVLVLVRVLSSPILTSMYYFCDYLYHPLSLSLSFYTIFLYIRIRDKIIDVVIHFI